MSSLFNLGNAYMRSGNLGKARLCYERAKRLSPDDGRIENNLAYVSSKVDDANAANSGKDKMPLRLIRRPFSIRYMIPSQ